MKGAWLWLVGGLSAIAVGAAAFQDPPLPRPEYDTAYGKDAPYSIPSTPLENEVVWPGDPDEIVAALDPPRNEIEAWEIEINVCSVNYGRPFARSGQPMCAERYEQCRPFMKALVKKLEKVRAPRSVVIACRKAARAAAEAPMASDDGYFGRILWAHPYRNLDGEAACLAKALGRSDLKTLDTLPEPAVCRVPTGGAFPDVSDTGPDVCASGAHEPACTAEERLARDQARTVALRVSTSLKNGCVAQAKLANPRFLWRNYMYCLEESLQLTEPGSQFERDPRPRR